ASEPHSFSRVFTGAFYDLLAWLLARALRETPKESDAAVERARRLAGRLLARAVETLPPGEARYREIALRMREVDQTEEGGVASIGIEEAFAGHGLRLPALTARQVRAPRYRALRALDPARLGGAAAVRAVLGLPARARLERREWKPRVGGGVREQYVHRETIAVRHPSLKGFRRIAVVFECGCTLTRDPSGDVEGASLLARRHPSPGEIAAAGGGTSKEHFRDKKPFRVGRSGVLERVYFD